MISDATKEAWLANQKVNLVLVNHLSSEMLTAGTPGGGYTVAQHLAHIVEATKYWGTRFDQSLTTLPDLYFDENEETGDFKAITDLAIIKEILIETLDKALESAKNTATMAGSPHPTADAYLIHMIVHDAHHRGQILLALKTSGHALPDENVFWSPWRGG